MARLSLKIVSRLKSNSVNDNSDKNDHLLDMNFSASGGSQNWVQFFALSELFQQIFVLKLATFDRLRIGCWRRAAA